VKTEKNRVLIVFETFEHENIPKSKEIKGELFMGFALSIDPKQEGKITFFS
jgi:hypothetical protein